MELNTNPRNNCYFGTGCSDYLFIFWNSFEITVPVFFPISNIDKDNGETPMVRNQLNAQTHRAAYRCVRGRWKWNYDLAFALLIMGNTERNHSLIDRCRGLMPRRPVYYQEAITLSSLVILPINLLIFIYLFTYVFIYYFFILFYFILFMRIFENKVLRKIFGAERDEIPGEWWKLLNVELYMHCILPLT